MSITIDQEARQRAKIPFDLDFMAERYQTDNGLYTFTSPSLWVIEKNLFYLLKNSVQVNLKPKYIRKPWLLSYDQYGIVTLEHLLMYVNGVFSAEEFDLATVILPTIETIIEICADKITPKANVSTLEKVEW